MENFKFNDILNVDYPNLEIEKDFPDRVLRAAQFAPFAALTGYDEAVFETARLTDSKIEIDEYEKEELNRKLNYLKDALKSLPEITITYFVADDRKTGGKYITKVGNVTKIPDYEKDVVFQDGTIIPFGDILSIDGELFLNIEN